MEDEQAIIEVKMGGDESLLGQAQNDFTSQTYIFLIQCKGHGKMADSGQWEGAVGVCASSDTRGLSSGRHCS